MRILRTVAGQLQQRGCLHIARTVEEFRSYHHSLQTKAFQTRQDTHQLLGFVPTMGALHQGHISLIERSKRELPYTATSIFVNPTQFSPGEDLDKYPRQVEQDLDILRKSGVDVVFLPQEQDMYPINRLCHVEPPAFTKLCEGQARPEFFRGVATIVCKLLNIVQPFKAYFGQKDISQCILIQRLVEDLNINTQIVVCETMRESDGLAMSSRNVYLTADERSKATVLYKALQAGKKLIESSMKTSYTREEIHQTIMDVLNKESTVKKVEYVSVASQNNMTELNNISTTPGAILSSAIRLGNVRLIDNLLVGKAEKDILRS